MLECLRKEVIKIKTITLRLDDELHRDFKIFAVKKGVTMQDFIVEMLKKELEISRTEEKK